MIKQAPSGHSSPVDGPEFLGTHRARSVASREFTRFSDALTKAAKEAAKRLEQEAPVTRHSPDRCIVQLGPVALTAAYIRGGNDVPSGGQLLAIVWRGTIAPRGDHVPERLGARHVPTPPVSLSEETYVVSADSESSWHWHPAGLDNEGYTSDELAERCIASLCRALETPDA